jgi:hypothetical protein
LFQEVNVVIEDEEAEHKQKVAKYGKESKRRETEQKQKDAFSLLSNVTRLVAIGSGTIRATMMAILVGSMKNENAAAYLIQNGFSQMRQAMVIKIKKETNKKRRKAKRAILLEEEAILKFQASLANHAAAKRARTNFNAILEGKDISSGHRRTRISQVKADVLVS